VQTYFKHQLPTRSEQRKEQKAANEKAWRACCVVVDARDHNVCRACGKRCKPFATTLLEKAHRHHIEYRSQGGMDVSENVVSLCYECHDGVHVKKTLWIDKLTAAGADGPLSFSRLNTESGEWFVYKQETASGLREGRDD